jgi:hypothetical protein
MIGEYRASGTMISDCSGHSLPEPDSVCDDGVGDLRDALVIGVGTVQHHPKRIIECAVRLDRDDSLRLGEFRTAVHVRHGFLCAGDEFGGCYAGRASVA